MLLTGVIHSTGIFAIDLISGPEPTIDTDNADILDIEKIHSESDGYYEKKRNLLDLLSCVSINTNYLEISTALTTPGYYLLEISDYQMDPDSPRPGFGEIIGMIQGYILFLMVYLAVCFGIAYVRFMRMDLR